jgi:hypothetical protein
MIVTRELLVHLNACQEAMDYLDTQDVWGLSRLAFIRALKDKGCPEYYAEWAASKRGLFSGAAVDFAGTGEKRDVWRVRGEGFDASVEYTDLAVVKSLVDAQVELKMLAEAEHYHVYAQQLHTDGGYVSIPCDLDSDTAPEAAHYVSSNVCTGVYEPFDNFLDAKRRCLEIKQFRRNGHAAQYFILQKIEEPDSSDEIGELLAHTGATL